jgi:phosphoribosylformylglycinamidine synthase
VKKFGVVIFPGSNCDADCYHALRDVVGVPTEYIWHEERDLSRFDGIVLPGGFTYGDYLRTGAIARFAPVMEAVAEFAEKGGLVIGICNGFQILLEAGLLPGAMLRNAHQRFSCKYVNLRVETHDTVFTRLARRGAVWRMPIAHGEGRYYADEQTLAELEASEQIVFRYCDERGAITPEANPNGSVGNIAGICNRKRNVLGMMPHPERCCEQMLGSTDGRFVFEGMVSGLVGGVFVEE